MGGLISKKEVPDDEERIKKYEQATENDLYGFAHENEEGRDIKWYQYLIYDIRFRIAYALAIAIIVGVIVPLVVFFVFFDNSDSTIYGSCLIKENSRFQCLINNLEPPNEESCVDALCCWEGNETLNTHEFRCFHSFPSAYQYKVSDLSLFDASNNQTGSKSSIGVELQIQPNHADRMSALNIGINWIDQNHLKIQMFNPKDYPQRSLARNRILKQEQLNDYGVEVNYGEDDYFFIRLGRNETQETIFDTRLGPINSGNGFISFTTILPTPFFYGLRGGEGIASKGTVTYGVVNGFENDELPFYMSLESSGFWHGVLLDTTNPFMVQVLQAPGIMFHVEGPAPEINIHVFTGSSQEQVLQQLHNFITSNSKIERPPYVPPYWGLGLHLCRKSANGTTALEHITALEESISYDSDCIDEDLRDPFSLDTEKFDNLQEIVDFLANSTKKIVLSQKVALKWNETAIGPVRNLLVMDKSNASNIHPFTGIIDNQTVYYPDLFHPDFSTNATRWGFDLSSIPFSGLILGDNFPKNENTSVTCTSPGSFLQNILLNGSSVTNYYNGSWGSICPNMVHTVADGESSGRTIEKTHFEVHNIYGLEGMKKFEAMALSDLTIQGRENERLLLSSSSRWTESSYYGSHNGMDVPFTWIGLRESLAHTLRQFVLSPFSGTPICGSYLPNESPVPDINLCLRWYQFGLLLPFAHHSYGHGNVSRGPLDFTPGYQAYLNVAIKQRYAYAPYYYTLALMYEETLVPPILPMSYYFHDKINRNTIFQLVDQFMIGEALLAAPIVTPGLTRSAYFPPGIWYDMDGLVTWDDPVRGGSKVISGFITQTPLFLRGGHVIPTLQNPVGKSILESREGNYTVLIGLVRNQSSTGFLIFDDGVQANSQRDKITFNVTNTLGPSEILLNFTMNSTNLNCDTLNETVSTQVSQIKILGFPLIMNNITLIVNNGPLIPSPIFAPVDETNVLRVYNLGLNWCEHPNIDITISAFVNYK